MILEDLIRQTAYLNSGENSKTSIIIYDRRFRGFQQSTRKRIESNQKRIIYYLSSDVTIQYAYLCFRILQLIGTNVRTSGARFQVPNLHGILHLIAYSPINRKSELRIISYHLLASKS